MAAEKVLYRVSAFICAKNRNGEIEIDGRKGEFGISRCEDGNLFMFWKQAESHIYEHVIPVLSQDVTCKHVSKSPGDKILWFHVRSTKVNMYIALEETADMPPKVLTSLIQLIMNCLDCTLSSAADETNDAARKAANTTVAQDTGSSVATSSANLKYSFHGAEDVNMSSIAQFRAKLTGRLQGDSESKSTMAEHIQQHRDFGNELTKLTHEQLLAYVQFTCTEDDVSLTEQSGAAQSSASSSAGLTLVCSAARELMRFRNRDELIAFFVEPSVHERMVAVAEGMYLVPVDYAALRALKSVDFLKLVECFCSALTTGTLGAAMRSLCMDGEVIQAADQGNVRRFVDYFADAFFRNIQDSDD